MFDWDNATVKVTVPVHFTASTEKQEVEIPIKVFAALLRGEDSLGPLAVVDEAPSPRCQAHSVVDGTNTVTNWQCCLRAGHPGDHYYDVAFLALKGAGA